MIKQEEYAAGERVSLVDKFGYLVGSWLLVFLAGCFMFVVSGLITGTLNKEDELVASDSAKVVLFFSILCNFILLSIIYMRTVKRKTRDVHFLVRYSIIGLWLGFFATVLLAYITMTSVDYDITKSSCISLEEQKERAIGATRPIGTDKGTGTAFAINADGTLLTADHVIDGAQEVYLNYATGKIPLQVIDRAPEFDTAILKSSEKIENHLSLTESYSQGDELYALGYPGNALTAGQATLSKGILSRVIDNDDLKLNSIDTPAKLEIIQTDTAINPGNSGGPLFGKCGVVGVVSAKSDFGQLKDYVGVVSEEGISFAISSKTVKNRFGSTIYSQE